MGDETLTRPAFDPTLSDFPFIDRMSTVVVVVVGHYDKIASQLFKALNKPSHRMTFEMDCVQQTGHI